MKQILTTLGLACLLYGSAVPEGLDPRTLEATGRQKKPQLPEGELLQPELTLVAEQAPQSSAPLSL